MSPRRKVFLIEERLYADLISEGLYASRVQYQYGGIMYDVMVEPDDYIELENDLEIEWEEEE
jgi:hypothetical protein